MKTIYFFPLFFALLIFCGCNKVKNDVHDYYPKVSTVSATVLPDGSVEVKGMLLSQGGSKIKYAGFCFDTTANPTMLKNQMLSTSIQNGIFSAVYTNFDINKRYYFRAWAANDFGYSYGDVIHLDDIEAEPVVAPCTPTMNTVDIGGYQPIGTYYSVDAPDRFMNEWRITASASNGTFNYNFGSELKTGIYTTTNYDNPGPGLVYITFYSGMLSGGLNAGTKVYVNQTGLEKWEITICDAPWNYESATYSFSTKFACPTP